MHARAQRKRLRAAALSGQAEDTLSCLRGDVNDGAEKRKRNSNIVMGSLVV
jgi:hypothetical protein